MGTELFMWYGYDLSGACAISYSASCWTGGLGTSHWNDSLSGNVVDVPAEGYYSSDDNNTLAYQLSSMRDAHIDWLLLSWWGYGQNSGTESVLDEAINAATLNLFKYLRAYQSIFPFKVAIMVEPYNQTNLSPIDYAHIYGYIQTHFVTPFNSSYFYWEGKPLVASFNAPWTGGGGPSGRLPQNYTFTYRLLGKPPNRVDWVFWEGMNYLSASGGTAQPYYYSFSPLVSLDHEVGLVWRYDDYYLYVHGGRSGYMRFDPSGSELMYNGQWNYAATHAGNINLILLYGWNEYHERSQLECHLDFTMGGTICQGPATAYYVEQFLKIANGQTLPSDPQSFAWVFVAFTVVLVVSALGIAVLVRLLRR